MAKSNPSPKKTKQPRKKNETKTPEATASPREKSKSEKKKEKGKEKDPPQDGVRETVEAIVMAFILAFLFRTFEAEAFVIPTGSMAPTLYGRHKEINCPECDIKYAIGASDELDNNTNTFLPHLRVTSAVCPNCRHEIDIRDLPVFKGDRILVNKFPFEFGNPNRWDVIVFKYPEDPRTNYIKRLVGLPGEYIRIKKGDLYSRSSLKEDWKILRKDNPYKQRVLQQLVYDDRYPPKTLLEKGFPERWANVELSSTGEGIAGWQQTDTGWQQDAATRSFSLTATPQPSWLRYRHFVPSGSDWDAALRDQQVTDGIDPQIITDFCGYNAYRGGTSTGLDSGTFWVGDLTVNFHLKLNEIVDDDAFLMLELIEGSRWYRCRIDPRTGIAKLFYVDQLFSGDDAEIEEIPIAEAETKLTKLGKYKISFANVDDRLCLWVNNRLTKFENKGEYQAAALVEPTQQDLTPVGIAAQGLEAEISKLVLQRDVYYRGEGVENDSLERPGEPHHSEFTGSEMSLRRAVSDPGQWAHLYRSSSDPDGIEFPKLGDDEFFVMGDNSPRSKDSRLWPNTRLAPRRHAVPRSALVGKAFFVYWPHGIPFLKDGQGFPIFNHKGGDEAKEYPSFRAPFYPYVTRMKRIR